MVDNDGNSDWLECIRTIYDFIIFICRFLMTSFSPSNTFSLSIQSESTPVLREGTLSADAYIYVSLLGALFFINWQGIRILCCSWYTYILEYFYIFTFERCAGNQSNWDKKLLNEGKLFKKMGKSMICMYDIIYIYNT